MGSLGRRDDALERLRRDDFDLLVVGGGIVGAGVALEASLHGLRCALVEGADFASGASSRSSKLVHGGFRYLATGDVDVVRESLAERAFLVRNAPTLVRPLAQRIPIEPIADIADGFAHLLETYTQLAGERTSLPPHRRRRDAFEYYEAVTEDFRLTLAVLRAAAARGATVVNHVRLVGLESGSDAVRAELRDELARERFTATARGVVLAVGARIGELARKLGRADDAPVRPSRGTHVVLRLDGRRLPTAIATRHPDDGRPIFVLPWKGHVLLGTTDTPCGREGPAEAPATRQDVAYLLDGIRPVLPDGCEPAAAWTGVRCLYADRDGGSTVDLSRGDRLLELAPRVVAVTGGKLTTFRPVARRALRLAVASCGLEAAPRPARFPQLRETLPAAGRGDDELLPGLELGRAALRAAARDELAATLDDVLTQRLGISLVAPADAAARAPAWADEVGDVLGWSAAKRERQVSDYVRGLDRFRLPA